MMKRVLVLVVTAAFLLAGCGAIRDVDVDIRPLCESQVRAEPHGEDWAKSRWEAESVDLYLRFSEPVFVNLGGADCLMRGDVELLSQFRWQ